MTNNKSRGPLVDPARFLDDLKQPGLASTVDLARWLAATMVVVGHARFPLLKGFGQLAPHQRPLWVQGWYFVTGYFVEAVLVFFVLSGFLVGGMVCARIKLGRFDAPGYAVDRFSRLYVAFVPALVLTVVLTAIGMHWFNATGLYDATNPTFVEKDTPIAFAVNTGWRVFLGNLAMLQFYFVAPYGSNPPLWTLSSEFWFYVVFGLAGTAAMTRGSGRWIAAGLALIAILVLGPMFWLYMGMWLIGVAAAILRPPRWPASAIALGLLFGLLLARRFGDAQFGPSPVLRYGLQFCICLAMGLLLLGIRARPPGWAVPLAKVNQIMADFSYSLYLTHFPIIILFVAIMGTVTHNPGFATGFPPNDGMALATYGGALIVAYGAAWLFSRATEQRTGVVRTRLKTLVLKRSAQGGAPGLKHEHAPQGLGGVLATGQVGSPTGPDHAGIE